MIEALGAIDERVDEGETMWTESHIYVLEISISYLEVSSGQLPPSSAPAWVVWRTRL